MQDGVQIVQHPPQLRPRAAQVLDQIGHALPLDQQLLGLGDQPLHLVPRQTPARPDAAAQDLELGPGDPAGGGHDRPLYEQAFDLPSGLV